MKYYRRISNIKNCLAGIPFQVAVFLRRSLHEDRTRVDPLHFRILNWPSQARKALRQDFYWSSFRLKFLCTTEHFCLSALIFIINLSQKAKIITLQLFRILMSMKFLFTRPYHLLIDVTAYFLLFLF